MMPNTREERLERAEQLPAWEQMKKEQLQSHGLWEFVRPVPANADEEAFNNDAAIDLVVDRSKGKLDEKKVTAWSVERLAREQKKLIAEAMIIIKKGLTLDHQNELLGISSAREVDCSSRTVWE